VDLKSEGLHCPCGFKSHRPYQLPGNLVVGGRGWMIGAYRSPSPIRASPGDARVPGNGSAHDRGVSQQGRPARQDFFNGLLGHAAGAPPFTPQALRQRAVARQRGMQHHRGVEQKPRTVRSPLVWVGGMALVFLSGGAFVLWSAHATAERRWVAAVRAIGLIELPQVHSSVGEDLWGPGSGVKVNELWMSEHGMLGREVRREMNLGFGESKVQLVQERGLLHSRVSVLFRVGGDPPEHLLTQVRSILDDAGVPLVVEP
jgi:hypothetical protein